MSDLIEAMARRIIAAHTLESYPGFPDDSLQNIVEEEWRFWEPEATAALAALRETHHLIPKDQEPVGWMYSAVYEGAPVVRIIDYRSTLYPARLGWTETPLYSLPEKHHD